MNSAFFVTFKRVLFIGLCCMALCGMALIAQADDPHEAGQSNAVANSTTQAQHTELATPVAPGESAISSSVVSQSSSYSSTVATAMAAPVTTSSITTPNNVAPIGSGRHLVSVTLALFGIIALIFAISWFVKRFGQGGFAQNQHIKILSTMPLGTRERIVLLDAGGQQLLLGITATAINTLHVFDEPVVLAEREERTSDFNRKLMSILQQKSQGTKGEQYNNNDNSVTR